MIKWKVIILDANNNRIQIATCESAEIAAEIVRCLCKAGEGAPSTIIVERTTTYPE